MPVSFRKRLIDQVAYEACAVFDVNNDGRLDIVCGEYWYEGPDFRNRHKICDVMRTGEYYDDFADYPLDVDGDGYPDIITGGWWGETLRWRRNPGPRGGEWDVFDIDRCGSIETIRFCDVDGCGAVEIFPNTPSAPQAFYKLERDQNGRGTGRFAKHVIGARPSGHGMGFADIDGDGWPDIVLSGGWLRHPANLYAEPWEFHEEFQLGLASVPILGLDIAGNGMTDLIVGQAHDYGLYWLEQTADATGRRAWVRHEIDPAHSQFHDLQLADLDRDGRLELITGKRYRAHNDGDPGAHDPLGLYYFKMEGRRFEKHVIDYGPAGQASGCGIYFWVADITGNGYPDIVAPGKDGLYLFENLGA